MRDHGLQCNSVEQSSTLCRQAATHVATTSGSVDSDAHMICCLKQLDIAVQKWFYWTDEAGNCFKLQLDNPRGRQITVVNSKKK